jgi:hypothetical protein
MDGFSVLDQRTWRPELYAETPEYKAGNAFGWLYRGNKQAATNYPLTGRLYLAKSGWLLLSVPNALVRGVFDAMAVPGTELPLAGVMNVPNVEADVLNAHISVMNADEVSKIGVDNINERGHMFPYRLGGMREINVKNVDGVSKIWVIQISSPELAALRKSYGLSPLMNGDHQFHITVAVRRKKVLQDNGVRKAAAADTQVNYECGCAGHCTCPDNCVCKVSGYCGSTKKAATADKLPGGVADGMPDSKFPPKALAEGAKHEHEHTSNDQAAKEIAKDHLSEDKSYYEKIKEIEKRSIAAHKDVLAQLLLAKEHSDNKRYAEKTDILRKLMQKAPQDWAVDDPKPYHKGVTHVPTKFKFHADPTAVPDGVKVAENVYMNQLRNMYSMRRPIVYDYNKPVFENIRNQAMEVKRRGDFMIQARQNHQRYMAALSPEYRYQLAMKAMRGEMEEPNFVEQVIYNNGDHLLNAAFGRPK